MIFHLLVQRPQQLPKALILARASVGTKLLELDVG